LFGRNLAVEAAASHIVLFAELGQRAKPMNAASTAHLLLCHSAVVTLARRSTPRVTSRRVSEQPTTSGTGKRADLCSIARLHLGDSTRRAPLTAVCALEALRWWARTRVTRFLMPVDRHSTDFGGNRGQGLLAIPHGPGLATSTSCAGGRLIGPLSWLQV
jgi:hypothetical protein